MPEGGPRYCSTVRRGSITSSVLSSALRERMEKKVCYLCDGVERTGLGMTITDAHASDGDVFNGIVVLKRQAERWRTHSDEYDGFNHILLAV